MPSEGTFSARLMAAMADMSNPTKSKVATVPTKSGGSYQYRYETLDQVLAVVRPALSEHGLALTQQQAWSGSTSSYVLRTIVFDEEEERLMDERPLRECPDAQAAGSWETYMRRYALRTAFGLAGEDDDGAAASQKRQKQAVKQPDDGGLLNAAKQRLWEACKAYGVAHDMEAKAVLEGIQERSGYAETPEWLSMAAIELEEANKADA